MKKNKQAFTLVELIVVITILAILATIGFIGYSNYIVGARDSARVQALQNIDKALTAYSTNKDLPYPEEKVEVKVGPSPNEKTIAYQGKLGDKIIDLIQYTGEGVDPKDGSYYSYYVTKNRNHFQLMAFLEDSSNLQNSKKTASLLPKTYAANIDYSDRYPTVWGEKLGILTDTNNTPIEDIDSIKTAGELNISNTTDTYVARIKDGDNPIEGTGGTLVAINPEASCKRLFEAKGIRADGVYTIDPEGNGTGFKVYCDMTTDGGGWTLILHAPNTTETSLATENEYNKENLLKKETGKISNVIINKINYKYIKVESLTNKGENIYLKDLKVGKTNGTYNSGKISYKLDGVYNNITGNVTSQETFLINSFYNNGSHDYGVLISRNNGSSHGIYYNSNNVFQANIELNVWAK